MDNNDKNEDGKGKWKRKHKYSMATKEELADRAIKIKKECDEQRAKDGLTWNTHKHKFTPKSKDGFLSQTVRETFPELRDARNTDPEFRKAVMMVHRAYVKKKKADSDASQSGLFFKPSKRKYRETGAGRKTRAVEVRQALFEWFVDVRGCLKGRLPKKLFVLKCRELYNSYLAEKEESGDPVPVEEQIKFTNKWIKGWMSEYRVSLRKPNKRYALSGQVRKARIIEYLKNVWRVRYFFTEKFGREPVIRGGDQMPLHRNENSSQKTLNITGSQAFVKENYSLSRERITVYTEISSDERNKLPTPEFLFKGKGTRTKLSPPEGVHVQWAPKGSFRLENMLETIKHLPNNHNLFSFSNYGIYMLDDYSVHVSEEVRKALLTKGWILIVLGGGITGDVQVNDTDIHHHLKSVYREKEATLMLDKLRNDPDKIPSPSRDELMELLVSSWKELKVDPTVALKKNFITNKFDGTEDFMVREEIYSLVGEEMVKFRKILISKDPPKTLSELLKIITPPEGVRLPSDSLSNSVPTDEGFELIDGSSSDEELDSDLETSSSDSDSETPGVNSDSVPEASTSISHSQLSNVEVRDHDLRMDIEFMNTFSEFLKTSREKASKQMLPVISSLGLKYKGAMISIKKRITLDRQNSETENHDSHESSVESQNITFTDHPDENTIATNVVHDPDDSSISIGDWVLVLYDGVTYPGEVRQIAQSDEGKNFEVSVMVGTGQRYRWPEREDILWYSEKQVVKRLGQPCPVASSSRFFSFDDL